MILNGYEGNREEAVRRIKEILKSHGIRMSIWAMEDLEINFEYQGESIIENGYNLNFDMFYEEKPK